MSDRKGWTEIKSAGPTHRREARDTQKPETLSSLGARLRAERERLGLTQAELAERMGTTQPTVARLEAGGVTPSLDTLHRAAEAFGLELVVDFRQRASA